MNAEHRRPLYRRFSEPATDSPVQPSGGAWLLAVERALFLEPAAAGSAAQLPRHPTRCFGGRESGEG